MDEKTHKIRIKVGDAEFEAEGSEETVKEQYRMFLDVLASMPKVLEAKPTEPPPASNDIPASPEGHPPESFSPAFLDRAYSQDRGVISLRMIPQGKNREADALLLLLFGYLVLKNEHDVYGTQLMKAARVSGLSIGRIDRIISTHRALYIRGGARRGARYALNNQGQARARQILKDLFMS